MKNKYRQLESVWELCERECEWSLISRRPGVTRIHGLSAVPVKRRCGRSPATEAMIDLVGKKCRYVLYSEHLGAIGGEDERVRANSVSVLYVPRRL